MKKMNLKSGKVSQVISEKIDIYVKLKIRLLGEHLPLCDGLLAKDLSEGEDIHYE